MGSVDIKVDQKKQRRGKGIVASQMAGQMEDWLALALLGECELKAGNPVYVVWPLIWNLVGFLFLVDLPWSNFVNEHFVPSGQMKPERERDRDREKERKREREMLFSKKFFEHLTICSGFPLQPSPFLPGPRREGWGRGRWRGVHHEVHMPHQAAQLRGEGEVKSCGISFTNDIRNSHCANALFD